MQVVVEKAQGRVAVTVLRVQGDLDGASYRELVDAAKKEYDAGAGNFLIDLKNVPFMSSAGLAALYSIVKMVRDDPLSESNWKNLTMAQLGTREIDPHVKLFDPSPRVVQLLKMAGVDQVLQIFISYDAAIASF